MNHYLEIANQYFHEIEGWHLYPGRNEWHLWAGGIAGFFLLLILLVWFVFIDQRPTLAGWQWLVTIVTAAAWSWVLQLIQDYRQKKLVEIVNTKFEQTFKTVNECCAYLLKEKLQVTESEFSSIAKEIKDMLELDRQFRSLSDLDGQYFLRKIYDPDSKQRILAGFFAMVALVSALIVHSLHSESIFFSLLEQATWSGIASIMLVTAMLYMILVGMQVFTLVMYDLLSTGLLKLMGRRWKGKMPLKYFVRHLIKYHIPRSLHS